tara:strand:+ start:1069 stop:1647 length:579 start_codon:yes stop_codon:yes gene_type:complete
MKIATKDKILISTLKLIDNKPFPQVSTKEIAELTGISEGTIFRHYKTKEILLQKLCEEFLNLTTSLDLSELKSEKEFKKKLVEFFKFLQKTENQIYKLMLYVAMYRKEQFKVFNDIFNINVYKKIESVVKQGTINWGYSKKINIKLHVRLLMYSIYFFTIQQQVFGADKIEKFNMNDVINTAVDNFLHGIKT